VADDSGCGEWVRAGEAGHVVPYGDPAAIAAVVNTRDYERDQAIIERQEEVRSAIRDEEVKLRATGCHGFCERGTLVVIQPEGILYQRVQPEAVPDIVEKTVKGGEILEEYLYDDPVTGEKYKLEKDIPFYKHQNRLILGMNGHIDPCSINDYIALGGYGALVKAFEMGPEAVLEEVKKSNIRGRGGAGFPAGRKWEGSRDAPDNPKYVLVNADEGDPGAFMDRSVLEGDPHSVIEAMAIAAYAVGADQGYVYVRAEYPLAVARLSQAIEQVRNSSIIEECFEVATDYCNHACQRLEKLPSSEARQSLYELADFIINRRR